MAHTEKQGIDRDNGPLVSVVIPTRNRPHLLPRAVNSALSQTHENLEVIVVVDGPDSATIDALEAIEDPRLRFRVNEVSLGGGAARNAGVAESKGEWVAFLDDDDEWLPEKLERQLAVVDATAPGMAFVFSRLFYTSKGRSTVVPRRAPRPSEPMSDYIICRDGLFGAEGGVQTSTLLVSRSLMQTVPFDWGLRKWQDIDWVLRASSTDGVRTFFCDAPLTVWHADGERQRIGTRYDWRQSFDWAAERRHLITPRAYATWQLVWVASEAARMRDYAATRQIWREAWRHGRPGPREVLLFLGVVAIPIGVRVKLHSLRFGWLGQRLHGLRRQLSRARP